MTLAIVRSLGSSFIYKEDVVPKCSPMVPLLSRFDYQKSDGSGELTEFAYMMIE